MYCVPLTSDSPSFASSTIGSSPARASASAPGMRSPSTHASPSPISGKREMRERREVADRADRAAARDARQDAAVEALDEQLDELDPRARVAHRERVRAQQHRRATTSAGYGSPTPQAWLRSNRTWSSAVSSSGIASRRSGRSRC